MKAVTNNSELLFAAHLDLCGGSCIGRHVQARIEPVAAPKADHQDSKSQVLLPRDAQRNRSGPQSAAQDWAQGSPSSANVNVSQKLGAGQTTYIAALPKVQDIRN